MSYEYKPNKRLQHVLDFLNNAGPTTYDVLHKNFGVSVTSGGWEMRNLDVTLQTGINEGLIRFNSRHEFECIKPRPRRQAATPEERDMMPEFIYTIGT